jgi:hypothetical protein
MLSESTPENFKLFLFGLSLPCTGSSNQDSSDWKFNWIIEHTCLFFPRFFSSCRVIVGICRTELRFQWFQWSFSRPISISHLEIVNHCNWKISDSRNKNGHSFFFYKLQGRKLHFLMGMLAKKKSRSSRMKSSAKIRWSKRESSNISFSSMLAKTNTRSRVHDIKMRKIFLVQKLK